VSGRDALFADAPIRLGSCGGSPVASTRSLDARVADGMAEKAIASVPGSANGRDPARMARAALGVAPHRMPTDPRPLAHDFAGRRA
jgi:hypothetical protein